MWERVTVPDLPFQIGIQSAVTAADKIYMFGYHSKKLLRYDPSGSTLQDLGKFRKAGGIGCLFGCRLYGVAEESDRHYLEYYDLETQDFVTEAELDFAVGGAAILEMPHYSE